MDVTVLHRPRVVPCTPADKALLHPECPIEQTFGGAHPEIQRELMQYASRRTAALEQALFFADYNGLRVLAHSEGALVRVADVLRHRFGGGLLTNRPVVRYGPGEPVMEPYMTVLVKGPLSHLPRVRNDIAHRHGSVSRVSERGGFVLEADAPLAALLGYERWLQELFGNDWDASYAALWLSRYVPIDANGPEAA